MFNDRYGLTAAVLEKRKTMMRSVERIDFYPGSREEQIEKFCKRSATDAKGRQVWLGFDNKGNWIAQLIPHYAIGEEVAVAQSYSSLYNHMLFYAGKEKALAYRSKLGSEPELQAGWSNKMFVRADLMPHRIRITDIRMERLQDISDEDCLREGIMEGEFMNTWDRFYFDSWGDVPNHITFRTPRTAFAALIDKVSGRGTWKRNPWVFAYEFELVK